MTDLILKQNFEIEEIRLDNMPQFEKFLLNNKTDYFRGESNSKWSLNSSMVRKIKTDLKDDIRYVLDYNKLKKITERYVKKYNSQISSVHSFPRILFYLQHSISFSPFIDITKNLWIAISFSLIELQENPNKLIENEISIYTFDITKRQKDNPKVLDTLTSVENILKKLSIGINKENFKKKEVEAYIININDLSMLNDRMQYQKGAFLLLNNYSLSQSNKSAQIYKDGDIKIVKYILSKDLAKELLAILEKDYKQYTVKYLKDPYLFLEE